MRSALPRQKYPLNQSFPSLIFLIFNYFAHAERNPAEQIFLAQALSGDLSNITALLEGVEGSDKVLETLYARFLDDQHGFYENDKRGVIRVRKKSCK